jgi:hypothetical protein
MCSKFVRMGQACISLFFCTYLQAVNPAPGKTLNAMLQIAPSLSMRTKMLPLYNQLDVFDRRPHPIRGTPPATPTGLQK